jgi:hypothetical protein
MASFYLVEWSRFADHTCLTAWCSSTSLRSSTTSVDHGALQKPSSSPDLGTVRARHDRRSRHLSAAVGRNVCRLRGGRQEVVKRLVNLLAGEPLLHLRVHLERRSRVLVTDLPRHVWERSRLGHQAERERPDGRIVVAVGQSCATQNDKPQSVGHSDDRLGNA